MKTFDSVRESGEVKRVGEGAKRVGEGSKRVGEGSKRVGEGASRFDGGAHTSEQADAFKKKEAAKSEARQKQKDDAKEAKKALKQEIKTHRHSRQKAEVAAMAAMDKIFPDKLSVENMINNAVPDAIKDLDSCMPFSDAVLTYVNGKAMWRQLPKFNNDLFLYPFRVYISDDAICVQEGNHYWWNQNTQVVDIKNLFEDGSNNWAVSACTIYVERTFDESNGSADVQIHRTTDDVATVMGSSGVTPSVARWVLATYDANPNEGLVQRWTGGDIYELRVA